MINSTISTVLITKNYNLPHIYSKKSLYVLINLLNMPLCFFLSDHITIFLLPLNLTKKFADQVKSRFFKICLYIFIISFIAQTDDLILKQTLYRESKKNLDSSYMSYF